MYETGLRQDVGSATIAQLRRDRLELGERDNSGFESIGRIRGRLEAAAGSIKPLEKAVEAYWTAVKEEDATEQTALLRDMQRKADDASCGVVRLAAMITRALASLDEATRPWPDSGFCLSRRRMFWAA